MLEGTRINTPKQIYTIFDLIKDVLLFILLSTYYIMESLFWTLVPPFLRPHKTLKNEIVLITGGASGVGRELSLKMSRNGANVVIWDINKDGMMKTCAQADAEGNKIHSYVVDLSDRNSIKKNAEKVQKEIGDVDILINNAGTVYGKTLLELSDDNIDMTFKVNILSHFWTVRAFLPQMIKNRKGHIVTVSSVTGMMGTYRCSDYSATKFATIGFHETLFTELRTHGHTNVHTTLVCPSYIETGMFEGVTPHLVGWLTPQYVADRVISSIQMNEVNCVIPVTIKYLLPLKHLLPAKMCWEMMNRIIKGPQSMMEFKGKPKVAGG